MNTAPSQYALATAIQTDYEARAAHHRMVKAHASRSDRAPTGDRLRSLRRFRRRGLFVRREGHVA
jgi:hypothetical protein